MKLFGVTGAFQFIFLMIELYCIVIHLIKSSAKYFATYILVVKGQQGRCKSGFLPTRPQL